jgi:hypothetical protein
MREHYSGAEITLLFGIPRNGGEAAAGRMRARCMNGQKEKRRVQRNRCTRRFEWKRAI